MRVVPIEYAEDLYCSENQYDTSSRLLLKSGTYLTSKRLDLLRSNGIFSLYVNDSYSMNIVTPPIPTDLKIEIIHEMLNLYEIVRLRYESGKEVEESTLRPLWKVTGLAGRIQYELRSAPMKTIGYTDIKSTFSYTVGHSLHVSILSLMVGIDLGLDKQKQNDLFLGSLFHDIGMNYVNEAIIMKNGKLNMIEFMKIKEHPQIGYNIFKGFSFGTAKMRNIILTHHERLDGSGYPKQLKTGKINQLSQIVAIVDGYDAMTSDRPYSRAVSPSEAIRHMSAGAGLQYDAAIMEQFFKKLQPYPEGSLVRLSNGSSAVVVIVNNGNPLQPVVIPINPKTKKMFTTPFDLSENSDVHITEVIYDILKV